MAWSWVGPAIGVVGGLMGADSANNAANTQAQSAAQSDATQRYMYDTTRADNAPFLQNGQAGSNRLSRLLGLSGDSGASDYGSLTRKFGANDLANDTVYNSGLQFGLDEGTKALNNQASANGSYLSGATAKALTRYGNDYATTKAGDAYNRYNNDNTNIYNRLAGITGAGQQAASQVGSAGANYGNNVSNTALGLGNARAASGIAAGNAIGTGFNNAYGNYQNSNYLNYLTKKGNAGSGYNSNPMIDQIYRDAGIA
jgi:hypothetical protein